MPVLWHPTDLRKQIYNDYINSSQVIIIIIIIVFPHFATSPIPSHLDRKRDIATEFNDLLLPIIDAT